MITSLRLVLTAVTVATVPVVSSVATTSSDTRTIQQPSTSTAGVVRALMTTEPNESGSSTLGFVLDTGVSRIDLPIDAQIPAEVGSRLSLRGGQEAIESGDAVVTATIAPTAKTYAPIASRNLAVVPVTWDGAAFTPERQSTLQSTLTKLDSWWSSSSSGIEDLSINTLPVTTIPAQTECDHNAMENAAKTAVAAAGLSTWTTNITVILPENRLCRWGGLGYMPGFTTWINVIDLMIIIHELGHNMGLPHANMCFSNETVSVNSTCKEKEYGDPTDPMGSAWNVDRISFGAEYLTKIGWLPQSQQTTWSGTTTTYTLSPIDITNGPGLRGIRINARGSLDTNAPGDYWLQYRAFGESSYPQSGVHLTVSPTKEFEKSVTGQNSVYGSATWLCDLTPGDGQWGADGWKSYGFPVNTPWTDPSGLFSVTVSVVTAGSATVTITPGQTLPNAPTNVVSEALLTDSTPDGRIKVSWTTTASVVTPGLSEPVIATATIDGTTRSCTTYARSKSCIIPGAPRTKDLTISVVGQNYAGTSAITSAKTAAIPISPPTGAFSFTSTPTSISLTLDITDTGGLPVTSIGAITLSSEQKCPAGINPCTFAGLFPRATYTATSKLENSAGTRNISASVSTLSQKPSAPNITARLDNGVPTAIVTAAKIDIYNIDAITAFCSTNRTTARVPYVSTQVAIQLPNGGQNDICWVYAINSLGYSSGATVIISQLTNEPKTIQNEVRETDDKIDSTPVITAKAIRLAGGNRVRVSWRVTNGDPSLVAVSKIAGRSCKRTGLTSCVASRVRRGRINVSVSMPGAQKVSIRTPR